MPDVPRPEAGGQLGEDRWIYGAQPCEAEPDALEERDSARTRIRRIIRGVGEHRRLARQPGVRRRPEGG
jgi:hypothetical protein